MKFRLRCLALLGLLTTAIAASAAADAPLPMLPPGMLCRLAIGAAERSAAIPSNLMAAIGRVESGRRDPLSGGWTPWPWTINAEGEGHFYDSKPEAIAAVRALLARGVRSIDVGCMQINLMHHPDAFASLEQAFDPASNATYAASFLNELFAQTHNWPKATGMYHSATPELGDEYQRRVMAVWPEEGQAQFASLQSGGGILPPGAFPPGRITVVIPSNRNEAPHIIPLAPGPGGIAPPGRGLSSYRAAPIAVIGRPLPPG